MENIKYQGGTPRRGGGEMRELEDSMGFLFLYTRHIYPLNLEHSTKKTLQLINLTMLLISITGLNPNNKGVCCRRLAASTPLDLRDCGAAGWERG